MTAAAFQLRGSSGARRIAPAPLRPVAVTAAVSLALTIGFLFLPLAGTDLAAQVARGHFVLAYGLHPVDFRWYGGIFPFGYSLLTGPANALLGARGVGASASVVGAVAFAVLLVRTRVPRPLTGSLLGAACLVFNLVSGRTTFALGVALGLLALCAVVVEELGGWPRHLLTFLLALSTTAASPVAGLFAGLCGAALLLTGRRLSGLLLAIGAGLPMLIPAVLFPGAGQQPFTPLSAVLAVGFSIAATLLVPARYAAVRIGGWLATAGVLLAAVVPNPVGYNATRLVVLFAIPVIAATSPLRRRWLALALALLAIWQPPLVLADLAGAGSPTAHRTFYQPLIDELKTRHPAARVEVVPLQDHWESTYVADAVPIARGWERQVDVARNPIFYDGDLSAGTYRDWLQDNGVDYVALARGVALDRWGKQEGAIVRSDPGYLRPVWSNRNWTLYAVAGDQSMVGGAGVVTDANATGVTFDAHRPGLVPVHVVWSRWLTLSGPAGCLLDQNGRTVVRIDQPGQYRVSSGWQLDQPDRC